ncbi:uncharacterized protein LOC128740118 [Sabethes cyaneus]|uniref:uncharacterized protein LOC128740118 n=1 Tax=Sabethes cyaneus TaxID=53552 RepID=UPI00237E26D1|nr:uncharacterized protein LOC128740118 [Sabethes cyaneus]
MPRPKNTPVTIVTPPEASTGESDEPCPCGRPDEAETNMVQCERCYRYYHFTCANVTASIAAEDRQFVCVACIPVVEPVPSVASSKSGRSTTASAKARAELELQRLEEEKEMERKYIAKKYNILHTQLDEEEEGSVRSRRSRRSTQRMQDWVMSQSVPTTSASTGSQQIPTGVPSRTGAIPKQTPSVLASQKLTTSSNPNVQAVQLQSTVSNAVVPIRSRPLIPQNANMLPSSAASDSAPLSEAAGGANANPLSLMNVSVSPLQNFDQSVQQLYEFERRMDALQLQLTNKSPSEHLQQPKSNPLHSNKVPDGQCTESVAESNHANRVSQYEVPKDNGNVPVSSSVSQTCSSSMNVTTCCGQINTTSLSIFDTTPPYTRPVVSVYQNIPHTSTGPRPTPSCLPFVPSHMSTPQHVTPPPFVCTVSSHLSPIVSPIVPESGANPVAPPATVSRQLFSVPNAQQLAARHVVPKDLPIFTGDPVEWPLFLSSLQNSTELCGYSDGENLMRLQRCLKGNALEAVRSYLLHPSSMPLIIDTLRTLYGRPDLIIGSLLAKVRSTPTPKPECLDTIISFGLACKNLCGHLRAAGLHNHQSNPILLQELVNKLPANIKLNWALFKRQQPVVDLATFGNFMDEIVTAASDVSCVYEAEGYRANKQEKNKSREKMYVNTHAANDTKEKPNNIRKEIQPKPCLVCHNEGHKVRDCYTFRNKSLSDRWKLAQERHLCRRCLVSHGKFPCKATVCGENGCEERHHRLLHPGKPPISEAPKTTSTVTVHRQLQQTIMFRILPVTLHGNGKAIKTYAFLDDGSSATLVESQIANELGIKGDVHPLCLQWTNDIARTEDDSQLVNLEISAAGHLKRHALKMVHTVKNLNLPAQSLDYSLISDQFPYLSGLPVESYESVTPTILIGLDNSHLKTALKHREGSSNEPIATKTRLGWTIFGAIMAKTNNKAQHQLHICARSPDTELHELVKEFFSSENVGTTILPKTESDDDLRARAILESTTVRTASGRFQTGLLWKYDNVKFPNSRPMAEKRFQCLERRLASKPELYMKVREQVKEYLSKGYAYRASKVDFDSFSNNRMWFLPLNVVINPKKPNKVRLVWDAAAKVQGQSLNSALLSGPDLLTPLPAVLSPFRQFQVAIAADISEMFHQIIIRPEDRSAQLFLWRDYPSQAFDVFIMKVATFGSTCSPSAAQYIKNLNAEEFSKEYPRAAEAIRKHHYVDDFLYSVDTTEEAIQLAQQVREVHSKAGFYIRNWLSNSSDVLTRVGENSAETSKCFAVDKSVCSERVLGMIWNPTTDLFVFQGLFSEDMLPLIQCAEVPTKRQALRVVMSIFDPLGLVAVFVIHGKILIQNIWRSKIDWDERISGELFSHWERWTNLLRQLEQIQIPRCYFPGSSVEAYHTIQLHTFVDASEEAFAAVAYLRIVENETVRCALVSAKTKVAPLKPMSIPRLELSAAVLGAKLAKAVAENHTLTINRRVFWSDSRTVLSWLRSDQRKYRQFVAFKVTEILELSDVNEWRWVSSRLNVADEATKWGKGPCINNDSRWFHAPSFLYQPASLWPQQDQRDSETVEELRPVHIHRQIAVDQLISFGRFSKWERMVRTIAYVFRFVRKLQRRVKNQSVDSQEWFSQEEIKTAESMAFKQIQQEAYADEIVIFTKNQQLKVEQRIKLEKISQLRKLSPFLDKQGVLRMDSRASVTTQVATDFKAPVILPKTHYGTQLLVNWYHRKYNHRVAETAVNEMRQRFYVSEMRAVFRKVGKLCQWCKVYKAVPAAPRMAPLPEERMTAFVRPFSFVGVDYFGPMIIKQGRNNVKRWVAIFTCLTVRAVHLELAYSLSTESCKQAIRRFIARRGAPAKIFSDQGTNFIGASNELKRELQQIYPNLASTFTNANTQWHFNPPSSPHMGGCWERMVRSVKSALASLSTVRKPDDETFWTLLIEAESIVNSRPLTYLPIESETHEALTPNCFLMLSTSGVNQPARPLIDGKWGPCSNWKVCQQLLDQFWSRWVKEYLPTITKRTKWFQDCKPVQVDDLVVVVEENQRNGWLRGRVIRVFPGRDGRVRSAEVQTATGIVHRPVIKLAVLEVAGTAGVNTQQYGSGDIPNGIEQKLSVGPKGLNTLQVTEH